MRVGLVGCCKSKLDVPSRASELYRGPLFLRSMAYVERGCDAWGILSAKHGLVMPDQVIAPYEKTLHDMKLPELIEWGEWAHARMHTLWPDPDTEFVVLAGYLYRFAVAVHSCCEFRSVIPMRGLAIGKQLQWLNRELGQ